MVKRTPYMFKDEQNKRDCIIQSMQLARELFSAEPPNGIKDQTDLLIYLGLAHLIEQSLAHEISKAPQKKKVQVAKVVGLADSAELKAYLKTQTRLRKAADRFLADPTRTMLQFSSL